MTKKSEALGTPWENEVTLQSLYYTSQLEPTACIGHIAPKLLLYAVADGNKFIPLKRQLEAFAKATQPKRLVESESEHLYTCSKEVVERNVEAQIAFLREYL